MASEEFFAKLDGTERSIINIDFMVTAHKDGLKILQAGKSAYMVELTVMKELESLSRLLDTLKQGYRDKGKNPDVLMAEYLLDGIDKPEEGCDLYGDHFSDVSGACYICQVKDECKELTTVNQEKENS